MLTVEGPWKGVGSSSSPWWGGLLWAGEGASFGSCALESRCVLGRGAWHLRPPREQQGLCDFRL